MTERIVRKGSQGTWEVGVLCPLRKHWVWAPLQAKRSDTAKKEAPGVTAELLRACAAEVLMQMTALAATRNALLLEAVTWEDKE